MNISVYITSYNQKFYLSEAIESVLNQTLMPDELLIVDDASTDGSKELIEKYAEEYPDLIRYHFNEVNVGITRSRNIALSLVRGDYITWLDGDDIYLPGKIEAQAKIFETTKVDLVFTNFFISSENIWDLRSIWCCNSKELPETENMFYEVLTKSFPRRMLFRYEMVKRELIESCGKYDEGLEIYEDFEYRIRLSSKGSFTYTLVPLSIYRLHGAGLSKANNKVHLNALNYIFRKHELSLKLLDTEYRGKAEIKIQNLLSSYRSEPITNSKSKFSILDPIRKVLAKIIKKS